MTSPEDNRNTGNVEFTRNKSNSKLVKIIAIILILAASGYAAKALFAPKSADSHGAVQAPPAPMVIVGEVLERDAVSEREYIGAVEAMQTVSLKPQSAGEITKVHFKEGSIVRAGQILFSIDSSRYQATVDLRNAEVEKAEANLARATKYFERVKTADKRSVSESDIELAESNVLQGKAGVAQARAALKLARIELSYTRITAPITGRIGAAAYTKGNFVSSATGALATIEQIDPIRVSFSMPDKDYLNQLETFKSGQSVYNTRLMLANGKTVPADGVRDFEDNRIDGKTGTLKMYLRYKNSDGLLIPGAMVRIVTQPVATERIKVIPQIAVLSDAEGDYVYTLGGGNVVVRHGVTLGTENGAMREVKSGLAAGDKIIIQGIQGIRPGMTVKPETPANNAEKSAAEVAMESESDGNGTVSPDISKPGAEASKTGEN